MVVSIIRTDLTGRDLRAFAAMSPDAKAALRMLAITLVLVEVDREKAAETCGIDRLVIGDWADR